MAQDFLRRELLLLQGRAGASAEATWLEVSEARASYLVQQNIVDEIGSVILSRELATPETLTKDTEDIDDAHRCSGLYGLRDTDDGCSVSDQDRAANEGLAAEVCNALTARSRRWQERFPHLQGANGRLQTGGTTQVGGNGLALSAEIEALQAVMQATAAHLAMVEQMKEVVEDGILQKQDKMDTVEVDINKTRAKAAVLKLRTLEYHFLLGTYRPEDVVALNKVWEELTARIQQLRTQVSEARNRLAVYRGLGPSFHDQLAQFRDVQRRLLDAQYMLETYNKLNSELDRDASNMLIDGHDCNEGGFGIY